jgi:hypothetical protein
MAANLPPDTERTADRPMDQLQRRMREAYDLIKKTVMTSFANSLSEDDWTQIDALIAYWQVNGMMGKFRQTSQAGPKLLTEKRPIIELPLSSMPILSPTRVGNSATGHDGSCN